MGTLAQLIVKADLIQADLDFLTQIELEPTANFTAVDNNDGTLTMTDTSTIHTAGFVVPNVTIDELRWHNLDTGELSSAAGPTFTVTESDSYSIKLTVTTNYGWQHTVTKSTAVVIDPVALFTYSVLNQNNQLHLTLHDGSTADPGSHINSKIIDWGDGSPTEQMGAAINAAHVFDQATGTTTIRLTVTTDLGGSHFLDKVVTWTIINEQPIADFDWNQTADLSVTFVDESSDPDGTIASWAWDFGDGTVSTAQNPAHVFPAYEVYTVTLQVTDNGGRTSAVMAQDVSVTDIFNVPDPPIADFSWVATDKSVAFTDASTTGSTMTQWLWTFGDGTSLGRTSSPDNTHVYENYGKYTVQLKVADDTGKTNTVRHSVFIEDHTVETPPVADFTVSTPAPLQRQLTDGSSAGSSAIVTWLYWWGDGTANSYGASATRTHTYNGTSVYTIRLTLTDTNGLTAIHTESVDLRYDIIQTGTATFTIDGCVVNLIA